MRPFFFTWRPSFSSTRDPARYLASRILVLALLRRMLHVEDDDFFGFLVNGIVDEVRIFRRHDLAHAFSALAASHLRKQNQILQSLIDGGTHALCGLGIACANV